MDAVVGCYFVVEEELSLRSLIVGPLEYSYRCIVAIAFVSEWNVGNQIMKHSIPRGFNGKGQELAAALRKNRSSRKTKCRTVQTSRIQCQHPSTGSSQGAKPTKTSKEHLLITDEGKPKWRGKDYRGLVPPRGFFKLISSSTIVLGHSACPHPQSSDPIGRPLRLITQMPRWSSLAQ